MSKVRYRQPTDAEYRGYDGMHCRWMWRALPDDWRCPCCRRTKRGLMCWGRRKGSNAVRYGPIGWKTAIVKHHDHEPCGGMDFGGDFGRFPTTIIGYFAIGDGPCVAALASMCCSHACLRHARTLAC